MLEKFSINMSLFQQERTIRIYLPKNYFNENKRYPVLYMHDGQNVFQDEDSISGVSLQVADYLNESSLEIIVVGIDFNTTGEERVNEYCPWINGEFSKRLLGHASASGGKGEAYLDFIINELKPVIDSKYRTLENDTSMAGISLGGLISTYAACRYPQIFSKITVLSPAFYRNQEEIENLLRNSDLSALERFYMDCGTKEAGEEEEISEIFLGSNKAIYAILKEKASNTKFTILEDAVHDYSDFKKRVPAVFSFLFSGEK